MKLYKKVFASLILVSSLTLVFAQEKETSVEDKYLSDDVDGDIIATLAESDDFENKLVALQYLESAIDGGNTSPAVIKALDHLAGEGITTQSRTNGRLQNNYSSVRREACLLLSKVPTEHSKNTLINIALNDNEPMVMAAAVQSLGKIGINKNDETVEAIAFANRKNQNLNPTSSLAMEVLNAYEALAESTENKKAIIDSVARISTDYHYVTPVRQKAYRLLKKLSDEAKSSKEKDKKKSETSENQTAQ